MSTLRNKLAVVACVCWFGQLANADHLPPEKRARGKAEHVLASVNVYTGKSADAVRRFGKPDRVEDITNSDYPVGSGERSYFWKRDGVLLRVGTVYRTDPKTTKTIESSPTIVDAWGLSLGGGLGATGAGLRLGQGLADVVRLYGARFQKDSNGLLIQWDDDTEMVLDFNETGRINHIHLEASVE